MTDVFTPEQRSRLMSRVRGRNTKPELMVRKGLFALGFRYRLHRSDLPGRPDLALSKYRAVVFVHGCFWHGHGCHLSRLPASNREFWDAKIKRNQERDARNITELREVGWRVLVIWECALRGRARRDFSELVGEAAQWFDRGCEMREISGLEEAHRSCADDKAGSNSGRDT